MDDKTNIYDLKNQVRIFCRDRDWDQFHNAKDLAIGIITESAELLEHFRFKSEKEVEEVFKNSDKKLEISEELADIFFFILRMSDKYDIDLSDVFIEKLRKNDIKYPVESSRGLNKKYSELLK